MYQFGCTKGGDDVEKLAVLLSIWESFERDQLNLDLHMLSEKFRNNQFMQFLTRIVTIYKYSFFSIPDLKIMLSRSSISFSFRNEIKKNKIDVLTVPNILLFCRLYESFVVLTLFSVYQNVHYFTVSLNSYYMKLVQ